MSLKRINKYLLFIPLLCFFVMPIIFSMGMIVVGSFDDARTITPLISQINDPAFLTSLRFSLYIGLCSTLLCGAIGFLLAIFLLSIPETHWFHKVMMIPVLFPHFIVAVMILMIFSQSGLISRIMGTFGWISTPADFPIVVFDHGGLGILFTYLWKEIPFATLMFYSNLTMLHKKYKELGMQYCTSRWDYYRHILLPLSRPMSISVFVLLFSYNFGAFEVPFLIGPTDPRPLAVTSFFLYQSSDLASRPTAMASNLIITLLSCLFLLVYLRSIASIKKWESGE